MATKFKAQSPKKKTKEVKIPSKLSKQEIDDFQRVFNFYDKRKDGKLSKGELDMMLKSLGLRLTPKELTDLFSDTDIDKTGAISFNEFVHAFCTKRRVPTTEELKEAFKSLDKNGDGVLSREEMMTGMAKISQPITQDGLNSLISLFDKNKDGKVSYSEFAKFLKG